MGKDTGFKEWSRRLPVKQPVAERIRNYREFYLPQDPDETRHQGGRCMDCGVPFCQQGCPLGNHIPDWNDLVYRDRWREAYQRLNATNNFPELTGRLCPAPCEAACVLAINQDAVTIEQLEKEIIERAFSQGWVEAKPPESRTGKRVAIVGSGPAGLAAAAQLNSVGHQVTVFEAADRFGGMLRYGIPDFKMEKWVIDRRLAILEAEGVDLRASVRIGVDIEWEELRAQYDAVLIAVGAQKHRDVELPGRELAGIHMAMDYLERQNRVVAGDPVEPLDASGKHVVILGGGDTGSDCYGTAIRQGAKSVVQIQLWPAPPEARAPHNPWPEWPLVFRTSSSQEEGGAREFACLSKRIIGDGERITALELVRIDAVPQPGSPRPKAVEIEGSHFEIPCDMLILAIGFAGHDDPHLGTQLGANADARGRILVDAEHRTSVPGVFCAGDAMRGASLIVWAIADGREAARHIDADLRNAESFLPTKGIDCPFEEHL